ncbi:MAG: hypothetical protein P4M01_01450 [Acidobacteriota bacterium]|nr:hypothetical protein [Acidobacteriota bacterium]
MKTLCRLLAVFLLCAPSLTAAANPQKSAARELYGFLLRQPRTAVEAALGKETSRESLGKGSAAYYYDLPGMADSALAAIYDKENRLIEIELSGDDFHGVTGFFGLKLGDTREKVTSVLGRPSSVQREESGGEEFERWEYNDRNYNLEFSADHQLDSIRIWDDDSEAEPPYPGAKTALAFAEAVRAHDAGKLVEMASGELECLRAGATLSDLGAVPARAAFSNPGSDLNACLLRAADAIELLAPEMKGVEAQMRVWQETGETGAVVKFPEPSLLKELVFAYECGAWRVYEVVFR